MTNPIEPVALQVSSPHEPEAGTGSATLDVEPDPRLQRVAAVQRTDVHILAVELAAGHLGPREAIHRLIEDTVDDLPAESRAGFRAFLWELIDTDPHLAALRSCIGKR